MNHLLLFEDFTRDTAAEVLYHGSKHEITQLEPRPSRVVDGEPVVFATPLRWLALVFAAGVAGDKLDVGFAGDFGDKGYVGEWVPGALDLLNVSAYIHHVSADGFHSDPRLGMQGSELIKETPTDIIHVEFVENVLDELRRIGIPLVPADELDAFVA